MAIEIRIEEVDERRSKPEDNSLKFGDVFTDHMFVMNFEKSRGWYDPRIMPFGPLSISPAAAAFHYGQTIFEGLKAYRTEDDRALLFRPRDNARRLNASASRLCMPEMEEDIFVDAIRALVDFERDWIPKGEGTSLYIRPVMFATEEHLALKPSARYTFAIILSPVGSYYPRGLAPTKILVESQQVRSVPGGVGAAKTGGNYARCLEAEVNASEMGYDQVLWLDGREREYVEEVGAMNVFFRFGDTIVTPPLTGTILPGITRNSVLTLLEDWGVPTKERRIPLSEVLEAHGDGTLEEAFGAGTAAVISPIGQLRCGDRDLAINSGSMGEMTARLYETLTGIQRGQIEDRFGWTVEVSGD
ncbi:MAG: branched-chain amino acid aminotransferase [Clostridia bacterium]